MLWVAVGLGGLPSIARAVPRFDLRQEVLVGDLGGGTLGRLYGDRFHDVGHLWLDNVAASLTLAPAHALIGRAEFAVTDDVERERGAVLGAIELGYRLQTMLSHGVQPFLSAGVGWVGGGVLCFETGLSCWGESMDPQLHLQAGLDVPLPAGWSGALRVPFRYILDEAAALGGITFGLRHDM
jgi:hypothetical protein